MRLIPVILILISLFTSEISNAQWVAQNSGVTTALNSAYFINADTGYVAGNGGKILKTTNGGNTWVQQTSGTTLSINSIFFTDAINGHAVTAGDGYGSNYILKTTDGGLTWSQQLSGVNYIELYSVYFTDINNGYVVGGGNGNQAIFKTTDAGLTWTNSTTGNLNSLGSVFFTSSDTGYAVTSYTSAMGGSYPILKTTNAGLSWTELTAITRKSSVFFPSSDIGYAAGSDNVSGIDAIHKTTNKGLTWTAIGPTGNDSYYNSVYFVNNNTGFVVGSLGYSTNVSAILRTDNGGSSWSNQYNPTTSVMKCVFAINADTVYAVGNNGVILKTTTGGVTPATIITQPEKIQLKKYHSSVQISVSAVGTPPLSYQWKKDGVNILNATSSVYNIPIADFSHDGLYTCAVSNYLRTVVSDTSELSIVDNFETVGDSVILTAVGATGDIQWQVSDDSLVWADISGATTNPYTFISTPSSVRKRSYRAVIINPFCPPFTQVYSETYRNRVFSGRNAVPYEILFKDCYVFNTDGFGNILMTTSDNQSGYYIWGCKGTYISTALSNSNGEANTAAILNGCSARPIAASTCDELNINGYSDWFLPAKDQQVLLYNNNSTIPNILSGNYWTSTEANSNNAWGTYSQYPSLNDKSSTYLVRCIREYSPTDVLKTICPVLVPDYPLTAGFSEQPGIQIKQNGDNAYFRVSTTGTKPITFQWKKDGVILPGKTDSVLTINNVNSVNEGFYLCEISNLCRTINSDSAELVIADNFEISGDSVELVLSSYTGSVQWQRSSDNTAWTDMTGGTTSPFAFISSLSEGDIVYYRAKVTDPACPAASISYSTVIKHKILTSVTNVKSGMRFNGGIVFDTDGSGNGLIIAENDQGDAPWGCYGTSIPAARSLTDGASNTTAIVSACSERPIAASVCDTLTLSDFSDWYLPSKNEQLQSNKNKDLIGNFENNYYWSSTESSDISDSPNLAWQTLFYDETYSAFHLKQNSHKVRCIRSFSSYDYKKKTIASFSVFQAVPVSINTNPADTFACNGSSITLSLVPAGTPPFTYQWKKDGADISNATDSLYTISGVSTSDNGMYTCNVTNICSTVQTDNAEFNAVVLTVNAGSDTTFCNTSPIQLNSGFTSNFPALSEPFSSVSWSPATGLNNDSIENPLAQPLNHTTTYGVTYTDALGCTAIDHVSLISITPIAFNTPLDDTYIACLSGSLTITPDISGTGPLSSIIWKKDGSVFFIGSTSIDLYIPVVSMSDEGNYTCELTNLCGTTISNSAELDVISITANAAAGDSTLCQWQNTTLNATAISNYPQYSGNFSYTWSPSDGVFDINQQNTNLSGDTSAIYSVQVTDDYGCSTSDDVPVFVQFPFGNENICLVTVDTLSWKNKIIWEKTPGVGTLGYNVYKEVATNVYSSIGFVNSADPASYVDIYSQPEAFANRYKISVVDTCGNESPRSQYHMTMNLTIAANGSTMGLNWSHYIDESGDFVPALYNIYRGTSPSNMTLLNSVPGTVNSYNDVNVYDVYYYIVGVEKSDGCNSSKAAISSFSNKKDNSTLVGINNIEMFTGTILISPNPMTTFVTLTIPNFEARNPKSETGTNSDFDIRISDLTGKVIRRELISNCLSERCEGSMKLTLDRGNLKPGIYFVEINTDRLFRGKLIVE